MTSVTKRSVVLNGHKTSVSLEGAFWQAFLDIARQRGMTVYELASEIDNARKLPNLSSALRVYVIEFYRKQMESEDGTNRSKTS